jgi:type 1 fimbria pilin
MVFASPVATAGGGGTITFVGAVVEPTCSVAGTPGDLNQVVSAAQVHPALQRSCSESVATTAATASTNARPYEVNVVHLSETESDQVLKYFANYVRAAQPGSADPVLLTQTYE